MNIISNQLFSQMFRYSLTEMNTDEGTIPTSADDRSISGLES
ncbi:hypothetical protein Hdeb2414_s0001g00002471 [Helianthus debilis subsp. tardiflorus]